MPQVWEDLIVATEIPELCGVYEQFVMFALQPLSLLKKVHAACPPLFSSFFHSHFSQLMRVLISRAPQQQW